MGHESEAKNCWAPEIFYDDSTETFLIFWSTIIPGRFPETDNPDDDNNHRIYYVSTQDFITYTPTKLFYDPGFNVIDAFITKTKDQYIMFVKNEKKHPAPAEKNIRITFSNNAIGPYGSASDSISPSWVEGPSAVKIDSLWYLYYDGYTRGRMEGVTSSDLESWSDITSKMSFPRGTQHGTVFRVSEDILNRLESL